MMISDDVRRRVAAQQEQAKQAAEVKKLKEDRWVIYPLPVQAMLALHLQLHGLNSVLDVTDILERYVQASKGTTNETCDDRPVPC